MRKLIALSIIAVTMFAASTAQATPKSAQHSDAVKTQQKRYYHALGYYRTIWHRARRTVYNPNPEIRARWQAASRYLKRVQENAQNEIKQLTQPPLPPHYADWLCIHRYEGSWTDSGAPYYGGLQMDLQFQATYGGDLLRTKGTADHWTPLEQMWVAEKAFKTRGFYPWPNTARYCGLI